MLLSSIKDKINKFNIYLNSIRTKKKKHSSLILYLTMKPDDFRKVLDLEKKNDKNLF